MREQNVIETDIYKIRFGLDEFNRYKTDYNGNYDIIYNPYDYDRLNCDTILFEIKNSQENYTFAFLGKSNSQDKDNYTSVELINEKLYILLGNEFIILNIETKEIIDNKNFDDFYLIQSFNIIGNNILMYGELDNIIIDENLNYITTLEKPQYAYDGLISIDKENKTIIVEDTSENKTYIFDFNGKLIK